MRQLLEHLHEEAAKRCGFRCHTHPTSIWIYAYVSKDDYGTGDTSLGWVGMSGWNQGREKTITIKRQR